MSFSSIINIYLNQLLALTNTYNMSNSNFSFPFYVNTYVSPKLIVNCDSDSIKMICIKKLELELVDSCN